MLKLGKPMAPMGIDKVGLAKTNQGSRADVGVIPARVRNRRLPKCAPRTSLEFMPNVKDEPHDRLARGVQQHDP